jgi:hypothetical protein
VILGAAVGMAALRVVVVSVDVALGILTFKKGDVFSGEADSGRRAPEHGGKEGWRGEERRSRGR